MKSAVLIVNWNSGQRLRYCLKSLPATPVTVVVDNASADDSVRLARDCAIPATYIENRNNRGLAAAINQGFAETSTPYVLLLNPDVRLPQGSAERLEEILDKDSRVGAVGGYVNEKYLPRPIPTPWTLILENCGFPAAATNPLGLQEVGQVAVAAMLVRREAYDQVKGFDDGFFPAWYEDVDFCNRLQAAGWKVCFDRQAQFVHEGGYSAEILGASDFLAAYYRNQIRYVNKYFSASAGLVRLSIAVGIATRWIRSRSRVTGCSRMITGALWDW